MKFKNKLRAGKSLATIISLVSIVILSVVFQGCEKDEGLDIKNNEALSQILREQIEISLKNSLKSASASEYELFNEKNIYSDYTRRIFKIAKKIMKDGNSESLKDYKVQLSKETEQIKIPKCFNDKISEIDIEIYQEIVLQLKDKTEPEIIKIFNTVNRFANDFICDDNQRERVLYTNEALKYIYTSQNTDFPVVRLKSIFTENSYGGYLLNDCGHRCGEKRLDNMSWQDWVAFGMNPALWTAALFATCISLCY